MKYKCLVADDEPIARQIIEKYISDIPDLTLSASCKNAFEVMQELNDKEIDIVFLDINMPKLSGISMLKTLKHYPEIVITTAYSEYAIDGFDLEVSDYLLKPISFERFLKAVVKVQKSIKVKQKDVKATPIKEQNNFIFVKSEKQQIRLPFGEIDYISSFGNYVKIYASEMILASYTLTEILDKLPSSSFIRIHKSYVINLNKIKLIEGNQMTLINGTKLSIGKTFRKKMSSHISKKS